MGIFVWIVLGRAARKPARSASVNSLIPGRDQPGQQRPEGERCVPAQASS
jgi:hypothetical protein